MSILTGDVENMQSNSGHSIILLILKLKILSSTEKCNWNSGGFAPIKALLMWASKLILIVEILLELPEIWTLFIEPLVAISHRQSRAQTRQLCISKWLSMCVGGTTTPILMSYEGERKH